MKPPNQQILYSAKSNPNPGSGNAEIIENLELLPDLLADMLLIYRKSTLDRKKAEALLYLKFKHEGDKKTVQEGNKKTVQELEALVRSDQGWYDISLAESVAESEYERIKEKHLSNKKLAELRVQF